MAFESLSDKLQAVFKKLRGKGKLSESDIKEVMREIRLALLEADVNYKVVRDFVKTVSERAVGAEVMESLTPAQQVIKIVNEEMTALMGSEQSKIEIASKPPTIIMMVGLQGAGKTTQAAKIALSFKNQGKRPLLAACDVYRPAAIKQLEVVGSQVGVPVFKIDGSKEPVKIARAAVEQAKKNGNDMVFIDTAGRLHIDETLMDELKNIKAEVEPNEILLVVDAMTGQDAVNVAEGFNNALGIDGVVMTKLDGDTRGGAALSVRAVTKKPIKFVGMGEKLTDIEPFHPDRMASRILGMGDVLSLIEKAQKNFDEKKLAEMDKKLRENKFDLEDFFDNIQQMKQMGSLSDILGMMPGVNKKALAGANLDDRQLDRIAAMIQSMTPYERQNPEIINSSRKRRIAQGSGTKIEDINRLLKQFDQMKRMVKQMSGKQGRKKLRGMGRLPFPM
ncbi:MAG: signal recognition particle protein [Clostridia bacterium]|nr:signal recognition particle protein [Clostridia bacterium]MBQ1434318.1 signal recognition particle protein [Clostridia bacterium]MBQ4249026.1 signal recognition particle protein [Clostridia bacterium]